MAILPNPATAYATSIADIEGWNPRSLAEQGLGLGTEHALAPTMRFSAPQKPRVHSKLDQIGPLALLL